MARKGYLLPLQRGDDGNIGLAVPGLLDDIGHMAAGLPGEIWSAFTLPRDVYRGKVDPFSDEGLSRTLGLAGLVGGGGILTAPRKAVQSISRASSNHSIYSPPVKPPRPFAADYLPEKWPNGPPADATGRLLADIEGRPLGARYVVGRKVSGGGDVALSPEELAAIAQGSAGASITDVAPRALGKDLGRLVKTTDRRSGNSNYEILLRRGLGSELRPRVAAHEVGHLIDDIAGKIPAENIPMHEVRRVYNDLNTSPTDFRMVRQERTGELVPQRYQMTPEAFAYTGGSVPREYMAEAIRAYMTDPNYLKSVAPETAARIREYVNANPRLNKTIQFNASGAPISTGPAMANDQGSPTYDQLATALRNADAAGDVEAARTLARALQGMQRPGADGDTLRNLATGMRAQRELAPMGATEAVLRGVPKGFLVGLSDEATAAAAASPLPGADRMRTTGAPNFNALDVLAGAARMGAEKLAPSIFGTSGGEQYDRTLESEREQDRRAANDQPIASAAGNIAGGIMNPVMRALPARGFVPGATGAAIAGGAYGFGEGEGSAAERALSAGKGMGVGALIGAARSARWPADSEALPLLRTPSSRPARDWAYWSRNSSRRNPCLCSASLRGAEHPVCWRPPRPINGRVENRHDGRRR